MSFINLPIFLGFRLYLCIVQVAVPYGITVDFDSLKAPHSVTLRERDSTTQIRLTACQKCNNPSEILRILK